MRRADLLMSQYDLVTPADADSWRTYHDIRRRVLFEARGQFGVYDDSRPDENAPGHHAKLLLEDGKPIGVVRIDIDGPQAVLRRVAICEDAQRRGHGRALVALAEHFAGGHGCRRLASHVAPDAVGFYEKCGFTVERLESESVLMSKPLSGS
jgi:GNAT superfamily N-acetyltransferase